MSEAEATMHGMTDGWEARLRTSAAAELPGLLAEDVRAALAELERLRVENSNLSADQPLLPAPWMEARLGEVVAERDEMRRFGREAEMERDTLAQANERLREQLAEAARLQQEKQEARTALHQLLWDLHRHPGTEVDLAQWEESFPWLKDPRL